MKCSQYFIGILLPIIITTGTIWIVDPHCTLHCTDQEKRRTAIYAHDRVALAIAVQEIKPDTILLGTSRTRMGLNPKLLQQSGKVLNMGMDAGQIYEIEKYFEHAQAIHPLQQVLLELDIINYHNMAHPDFNPKRLKSTTSANNSWQYNLTKTRDLYSEFTSYTSIKNSICKILKCRYFQKVQPFEKGVSLVKMQHIEDKTDLIEFEGNPDTEFEKMLTIAHNNNITFTIYIPPLPVSQYISRNWNDFMQWKRKLRNIIKKVYGENEDLVRIWDFSGFSTITTAPLTMENNVLANEWFINVTHFSTTTGKLILKRIYNDCGKSCDIPSDFGVQLTTNNLDPILAEQTKQYIKYSRK